MLNEKKNPPKRTRLKNYDYSSNGVYFVTICAKNNKCSLGDITNGNIQLSKIGVILQEYWQEIPEHFNNTELDEFIIMPNHFHGIIVINNIEPRALHPEGHGAVFQKTNQFSKTIAGSLSIIINQFKSSVTRWSRKNGFSDFLWQSRFYEHIIRNEKALDKIREYIRNNPIKWELDEYYNV